VDKVGEFVLKLRVINPMWFTINKNGVFIMRILSLLLLVTTSATASINAVADTCGELAAKFADEDKRDMMSVGQMDDLRLCVGEWMRDQVLQHNRPTNAALSEAASALPTAQMIQK
jgi:hypothetical protein